ncbi:MULTISPECIES: glycosyltransferase family 9 protein [unclassified Frankia]
MAEKDGCQRAGFGPFVREPLEGVRRIAVLRASGLGDFVLALPALEALRAAYPDAHLVYLGLPWHVELLAGRPGPWDEVAAIPPWPGVSTSTQGPSPTGTAPTSATTDDLRTDGTRADDEVRTDRVRDGGVRDGEVRDGAVRAFVRRHRVARYDLALQLHGGGAHSTPLVHALGARFTAGGRDVGAPPLHRSVPFRHLQHETLRNLEIVGLVGASPVTLNPGLTVTADDRRAAAEAMAGAEVTAGAAPLVVLHPGASDPRRRWPVDRFAGVANALAADGARIMIVGVAAERALAERLAAGVSGPVVNLAGRLCLPGLVGILATADLMIGNDSGPRHLAGALGIPTVGVFWCGNVINAGPLERARHRIATSLSDDLPGMWGEPGARAMPPQPVVRRGCIRGRGPRRSPEPARPGLEGTPRVRLTRLRSIGQPPFDDRDGQPIPACISKSSAPMPTSQYTQSASRVGATCPPGGW